MPFDMTQRSSVDQQYMDSMSDQFPRDTKEIRAPSMITLKESKESEDKSTQSKHSRLNDLPLIPREEIQNMMYVALKNVTQLFDISESKGVGMATCISSTGSRFLAIGTSMGNVALFEIGVKGYRTLSTQ